MPVGIYAPSFFKKPKDMVSGLVEVLVQRKIVENLSDPMKYPYIVVDPDNFVSPSVMCQDINCERMISISQYFKYNEPANSFLIIGNVIHRYLEWLIRK